METGARLHFEDDRSSLILDHEKFKPWKINQSSRMAKYDTHQCIGAFFEHLGAHVLGGGIEVPHDIEGDTQPDLWIERARALVEVKSVGKSNGAKCGDKQFRLYKELKKPVWYFFFVHDARNLMDARPGDLIRNLKSNIKYALLIDLSILDQILAKPEMSFQGPYSGSLETSRHASVRVARDLTPFHTRTESALCTLRLNPEHYSIHRRVECSYSYPFILTSVLPNQFKSFFRTKRSKETAIDAPF